MRSAVAHDVSARMRYAKEDLEQAVTSSLALVAKRGGDGGVIAIDQAGMIVMKYNSDGMKCASVRSGEAAQISVFDPHGRV